MLYGRNDFVKKVQDVIYAGAGINPLVGSGASSASGIIMGLEFSDYLAYVVQQSIKNADAWNLRKNDWPPYPPSETYSQVRNWTNDAFRRFFDCKDSPFHIEYDGSQIKSIKPKTNSLSDHLNCPGAPNNIRSTKFTAYDPSLHHINVTLRQVKTTVDPYEPLWIKPEVSPTSSDWILELALRALADWRATLRFLSRLKKESNGRVVLTSAEDSVIDRFNTFITAERQPNLTHKMLAALARPLRMRTILTTNFDTLLEDAFAQSGHYLKKFFVSRRGRLPDPFLVRAQPSIIKLHGELLETRADFSLDGDPPILEKRRFFRYFVDTRVGKESFLSMLSHTLVLGYSGNDVRTIRMLQYLLDETSHFQTENQPKLFWVCVTDGDVWRVGKYFERYPQDRIIVCQTDRPDLLLLELYQKVVRAIPVAGQTYEYNHNVPPSRPDEGRIVSLASVESSIIHNTAIDALSRLDTADESSVQEARDGLAFVAGDMLHTRFTGEQGILTTPSLIYQHFQIRNVKDIVTGIGKRFPEQRKFWIRIEKRIRYADQILFFDAACGALESLSFLHYKLSQKGKRCLWFELADYVNGDGLLRDVLRSVALRTGRFQRQHVTLHPLEQSLRKSVLDMRRSLDATNDMYEVTSRIRTYLDQLCDVHRLSPADWPILIYGRDLAGSCVNWQSRAWDVATWQELELLIGGLACAGFPVLLAHSSDERLAREIDKLSNAVTYATKTAKSRRRHPQQEFVHASNSTSKVELPESFNSTVLPDQRLSSFAMMRNAVFDRCMTDSDYRNFIYAICLFRQSRRPSALFYEAVQPCANRFNLNGIDNDIRRAAFAEEVILHLEVNKVFYVKAGGSSWMHRDIRIALQMMLDSVPIKEGATTRWHSYSAARSHFWIGDWYEKAFNSTGFSKPALEALHHYYQAARLACFAIPKGLSTSDKEKLACYRYLLIRASLNAMTKLLLVSRPFMKLWIANLHGFPMFELSTRASKDTYQDLMKWLWPDLHCPEYGLQVKQREELGNCFALFRVVTQDTQRAICNEADIQIAPEAAPTNVSPNFGAAATREKLNALLQSVYSSARNWNSCADTLVAHLSHQFGGNTSDVQEAFRVCLPCGKTAAFIKPDELAAKKGIAIAAIGKNFDRLASLMAVIESLAYAQMRRAKFQGHAIDNDKDHDRSWRSANVRNEWLRVTRICNLGIDWCKHLHPNALQLDSEIRIRLHSYYAVALANLDRFYEAHRHLTEALAIQSKHNWAAPRLEQAKLSLRRAEVILTEAHRIGLALKFVVDGIHTGSKKQTELVRNDFVSFLEINGLKERIENVTKAKYGFYDVEWHPALRECLVVGQNKAATVLQMLKRLLVGMLDDAWFSVANAEKALSGNSQSSLWWGRAALLKLRACGYQKDLWLQPFDRPDEVFGSSELRMLAYRHRQINPQAIWQIFESARLNDRHRSRSMKYREFRLVRYIANCLQVFALCKDEVDFVRARCSELKIHYCSSKYFAREGIVLTAEMKIIYDNAVHSIEKACKALKQV